jgi:hypothetical protein
MAAHLFRKYKNAIPAKLFRRLINLWPPFLAAGIHVVDASEDLRILTVELKRTWYNINYVGVQFGGSIYAMVDPFYMLMLMHNLGDDFIVWDQAARVSFMRPGRSALRARFQIDQQLLDEIKQRTASGEKYVFDLPVDIFDSQNEKVANVIKTLYVRVKVKT